MRKAMSKKKRTIMTVTGIALMIPGFIIAVKNFYFVIETPAGDQDDGQ